MQRRRTQLKTEAHKRIDEGHAVIPLVRNGKAPLWKGWQEKATTDHTAIDTRWPDDVNIGSVTRSRLVVDCDVKNGEHGAWNFTHWLVENGLDSRPPTLIVVTPSGGSHVYYDRPADLILGNSTGSLPAGIDVRGRGGFVVAEGSVINGRKYYRHGNSADTIAPMPQPLIDALVRPVRSAVVPPRAAQPGGGRDYFEEACVRVSALRRGSRHVELLRIANRVGHLMADGVITYHRSVIEGELLDAVSQQAEPDDLRSAEITIRDGLDNALRTHVYRPVHAVPPPLSEGLGV